MLMWNQYDCLWQKAFKGSRMTFLTALLLVLVQSACSVRGSALEALMDDDTDLYVMLYISQDNNSLDIDSVCLPVSGIVSELANNPSTKNMATDMNLLQQSIISGQPLALPNGHGLFDDALCCNVEVDSIYAKGYEKRNHRFLGVENDTVSDPAYRALLHHYFFFYADGVSVENLYVCLDRVHSACGSSVYYGHSSTPAFYRESDEVMDERKLSYIVSLLFKKGIYCSLDDNGNIRLMNTNLTLHDIVEIPYPIVEIR